METKVTPQVSNSILNFVEAPVSPEQLREAVVLRIAALLQRPVLRFDVLEQCGNVVYARFVMVGKDDPVIPLPLVSMPKGFNDALRELVKCLEWLAERRLEPKRFFELATEQVNLALRYLPHSRLTAEERSYVRGKLRLCVAYPNKVL